MRRYWWALLGPTLFACTQHPEEACNLSTDKVLLAMRQGGVVPEKNLEGQAAVDLRDYLTSLGASMPENVDQALIFVKENQAMIAFFWHDCFIGDITGPWSPPLGVDTLLEILDGNGNTDHSKTTRPRQTTPTTALK
jgi:hypothetical protein